MSAATAEALMGVFAFLSGVGLVIGLLGREFRKAKKRGECACCGRPAEFRKGREEI